MEYGLSAIRACIDDETIASLCNPCFLRKFARNGKEIAGKWFVFGFQRADGFNVPVWNDQNVGRRDRMSIAKGSDLIITVKNGRLSFP